MGYSVFSPTPAAASSLSARSFNRVFDLIKIPRTGITFQKLASSGIAASAIGELLAIGYEWQELKWIISKRKYQRSAPDANLSLRESEQLLRLLKIHALAIEVLGNNAKAILWMRKPRKAFDSLSGIELTKLECGARIVEDSLFNIDEGYF
jgi:putative toxin-antitoxin system antitoxin component (TIGR02293 family)